MKKPKKSAEEKTLDWLAYITFIYFGFRFIFSVIFMFNETYTEFFGILNAIASPLLMAFGVLCGYFILKRKLWAIIAAMAILAWTTAVMIANYIYVEMPVKLPTAQIAYFAFLILGLLNLIKINKQLKKKRKA